MRLINADSIKFRPYYDEYVDYDGYINDLKTWQLDDILSDRVDNTPTVNAIPVEWFKNLIKTVEDSKNYEESEILKWALYKWENKETENGRSE